MMFPPSHTITLEAAIRDLGSKDPRVRAAAADALGGVPDEHDRDQAADALLRVIGDDRFEVRCSAILALGDLGVPRAVDPLVDCLHDGHPEVRQCSVIALGRLGDVRAFDALAVALREGSAEVRFQAAVSLVELDPARAYEPLIAALADPDAQVRANAAAALGAIADPRAAGWLAKLLDDPESRTRFEAASALAQLGDGRGFEVLAAHVSDRDVAYQAIEGLEAIKDPRAAAHLAPQIRRLFLSPLLRVRAAAALLAVDPGHADAAGALSYLKRAARSRRDDVRGLAEESIARLADAVGH